MMNVMLFISAVTEQVQSQTVTGHLSQWLPAALLTAAALVTNKQFRRQKRKLLFLFLKTKLFSGLKRKLEHPGLFIVSIVLILGCFGVAIALGMLKEFLILIGVVVLFLLLFMAAARNS